MIKGEIENRKNLCTDNKFNENIFFQEFFFSLRIIIFFSSLFIALSVEKMTILQPIFNILTICGCRMPSSCRTSYKKMLYILYAIFVLLLLYSFCISQFLNVIINVRTADELCNSFYMFIASLLSCCKIVALLMNHKAIKIFRRRLEEEPCKPMNIKEVMIQKSFDKNIG